jgi:adenine C2-methylase RlmN of 23S rRNA A2503 and tRNA A37
LKDIRTLSLDQLKDYFSTIGDKPFRAKQVYDWLWSKNLHSFDEMTNLSKNLRDNLSAIFSSTRLLSIYYKNQQTEPLKTASSFTTD